MQQKTQEILLSLKDLLEEINLLRQRASDIEAGLAEAKRVYEGNLGELNAEADRLQVLRYSLRARLQEKQFTSEASEPESFTSSSMVPEENSLLPTLQPDAPTQDFQPRPEELRRRRKQRLADHIYYFIDPTQDSVIRLVNAILVNETTDVGEMLERLVWGEIWAERAEWESLDDQYQRLIEWHQALKDRLAYWQGMINSLESDTGHALWLEWQKGETQWNEFLGELTNKQKNENERIAHEVKILEIELNSKENR